MPEVPVTDDTPAPRYIVSGGILHVPGRRPVAHGWLTNGERRFRVFNFDQLKALTAEGLQVDGSPLPKHTTLAAPAKPKRPASKVGRVRSRQATPAELEAMRANMSPQARRKAEDLDRQ